MKHKLALFRALPYWLAVRIGLLSLARKVFKIPVSFSYSQGAEDILLPYIWRYHFSQTEPGRYVDVGCNSPVRYSNTFELYLQGWRGINIDANRDLIKDCKRVRKQDISIRAAVSDSEREVTFHKAKKDAVSTIDEKRLVEWKKHFEFSEADQEKVTTQTLTKILDENLEKGSNVDLLTIDVEGHDLQVLRGLDLEKYRPKIIIIEMHDFHGIEDSEIYRHLNANGYELKYFAVLNAYFVDGNVSK